MFDTNYDTLMWALQKNGFENLLIIVSEIGWPTDGDRNANSEYAQRFNQGFMSHISAGKGAPMRLGPVDAYLFILIDEDAKSITPGNFECNWGIFYLDGTPKYSFNLGTTNSDVLVPAQGMQYLAYQWCIFKPSTKLNDPQVAPSLSYACANGDYTSRLEDELRSVDGNISYAFNSYYHINNQLDDLCKFKVIWGLWLRAIWG